MEYRFIKSKPATEIVVTNDTSTGKLFQWYKYISYKHEETTFETLVEYVSPTIMTGKLCKICSVWHITKSER